MGAAQQSRLDAGARAERHAERAGQRRGDTRQTRAVFILYGTAIAYENNEVHFYDDIYGHDAKLAEALAKGYPYP